MSDDNGLAKQWPTWLSMEDACVYTGRSLATLKNWVSAGKVEKRLVDKPGARARAHLCRRDLDRIINTPVHTPVVAEHISQTITDTLPSEMTGRGDEPKELTLASLASQTLAISLKPVLEQAEAWFKRQERASKRPAVQIPEKLTWTLKEAREMTGLTEPALRELIGRKPDLVIRQGRRWWVKAEGLRKALG